jgi:hypothetical protein
MAPRKHKQIVAGQLDWARSGRPVEKEICPIGNLAAPRAEDGQENLIKWTAAAARPNESLTVVAGGNLALSSQTIVIAWRRLERSANTKCKQIMLNCSSAARRQTVGRPGEALSSGSRARTAAGLFAPAAGPAGA